MLSIGSLAIASRMVNNCKPILNRESRGKTDKGNNELTESTPVCFRNVLRVVELNMIIRD